MKSSTRRPVFPVSDLERLRGGGAVEDLERIEPVLADRLLLRAPLLDLAVDGLSRAALLSVVLDIAVAGRPLGISEYGGGGAACDGTDGTGGLVCALGVDFVEGLYGPRDGFCFARQDEVGVCASLASMSSLRLATARDLSRYSRCSRITLRVPSTALARLSSIASLVDQSSGVGDMALRYG